MKLLRLRNDLKARDYFYATNLDLAVLGAVARLLTGSKGALIYQVLDVRAALQRKSISGYVLRFIERALLSRIDLLIVSSPGFVDHYFRPVQNFEGNWALLENKVYEEGSLGLRPSSQRAAKLAEDRVRRAGRWSIGWFGTLRCSTSLTLLCEIARRMENNVRIVIAGAPVAIGESAFRAAIGRYSNIEFYGRYKSPENLADLYNQVDFVWCVDLTSATDKNDRNPMWLLPNRLYEGGYFAVPAITAEGTQSSKKVLNDQSGWSFPGDIASEVVDFLSILTISEYLNKVKQIAALPTGHYCDDGTDLVSLFSKHFSDLRLSREGVLASVSIG